MADRRQFLAGCALAALLAMHAAHAQEDAPPAATATGQIAIKASSIVALNTIIVRRQKVERTPQDTIASIAAMQFSNAAPIENAELFATNVTDEECFTFNSRGPNRGAAGIVGEPRVISDRIIVNL